MAHSIGFEMMYLALKISVRSSLVTFSYAIAFELGAVRNLQLLIVNREVINHNNIHLDSQIVFSEDISYGSMQNLCNNHTN